MRAAPADVWFVTSHITGGDAMLKSPRAIGEAVRAWLTEGLHPGWRAADGTPISARQLH